MTIQERAQEAVERAIESADGPWASVEMEGDWHASEAKEIANAFERRGYRVEVKMWEDRFVVFARKRKADGPFVDDRLVAHIANHDLEYVDRILDAVQRHPDQFGAVAGESKLAVAADVLERIVEEQE